MTVADEKLFLISRKSEKFLFVRKLLIISHEESFQRDLIDSLIDWGLLEEEKL